jgi:hypothetical protein
MNIKKAVILEINNETEIKINQSYYLISETQNYYKNGKLKGQPIENFEYYFFNDDLKHQNFLDYLQKNNIKIYKGFIEMLVKDGLKYDSNFLTKNLNKSINFN